METPQEIEVWYIIPAIRREITKALLAKGLKQRKIAEILGIKESAVSQYLSNKRGGDVKFEKNMLNEIKKSADMLVETPEKAMAEIHRLTKVMKQTKGTCKIHKQKNPEMCDCEVCICQE